MLLVELFRGTGSVGVVARKLGWKVISVDMDPGHNATHTIDVRRFKYKEIPTPDFVWASPPCTTYSFAANWVHHREAGTGRALTDSAKEADSILTHTLKMIRYWLKQNPKLRFCIENPRGYLRNRPEMKYFLRTTVLYSDYGWPIHKPTDFWTNFPLELRPMGSRKSKRRSARIIQIGKDPGWRKSLKKALGGNATQSQAVLLGRIPPTLVRSILTQMTMSQTDHNYNNNDV